MTRRLAMIALLTATTGLASCDRSASTAANSDSGTPAAGDALATPTRPADATPEASVATGPAGERIEGAPAFAVVYPGGVIETTPLTTASTSGGGIIFTSTASPDEIVEFYRQKAEAAGLASIMSMNQGETRGYGATGSSGGAGLQVVAHPVETGQTSVQVTWTASQ